MILSLLCSALVLTPLVFGTVTVTTNITVPYSDSTQTGRWTLRSNIARATTSSPPTLAPGIGSVIGNGNSILSSPQTVSGSSAGATTSSPTPAGGGTSNSTNATMSGPTLAGGGNSSSTSQSKTGIIVGSVIGGLVALVCVWILIRRFVPPCLPRKEPTFIFKGPLFVNGQEKRDQIQITFIITFKDVPPVDAANRFTEHKVVWRVFDIGDQEERSFKLPYDLAFGTSETGGAFETGHALPKNLLALRADNGLSWKRRTKPGHNLDRVIQAKNETDLARAIVLGSYTVTKAGETFYPFLSINDFPPDAVYTASQDLVLYAYRTQDCREGQVLTNELMLTESLFTGREGVEIRKLQPVTNWHLVPSGDEGKFKLVEDSSVMPRVVTAV